jgi:hypothetical protein
VWWHGNSCSFPSCAAVQRPGTGLRVSGSPPGAAGVWLDNVVVQNFQTSQYDIFNSVIVGKIWADNAGVTCGYGSTVGIHYGPGANVNPDQIYTNQQNVPFYTESNNNRPRVNLLSINYGNGGLLLGSAPNPAALNVGTLLIANMSGWESTSGTRPQTSMPNMHIFRTSTPAQSPTSRAPTPWC